ncbi:MAG: HlyD family type I secretion periplasmic adaptor subunit [Alphaproteobacteria bacterium]|nr:HlyD family type I secretion periplasmic adaptor subunit [Alphaproteobacteria bacterium]
MNSDNLSNNDTRITREETYPPVAKNTTRIGKIIEKTADVTRQVKTKPVSYYTRFLSRAILLEESGPPQAVVSTVGIIALFLFGMITWASVTTLNETSIARGEILPASSVKPVQHLEGGIIAQVLVHEGDKVKKGQTILRMAPTTALSNLDRVKARYMALNLQITRLKAFAGNTKEDLSAYEKDYPQLVRDQQDVLTQQNKSRTAQQRVILSQLAEKRNELVLLDRKALSERKNLEIIAEEMAIRQELTDKGLGSKLKLLNARRSHNQAESELNQTLLRKAGIRANIDQVKGNLVALNERLRNEALIKVDSLSNERAQVSAQLLQLQDRVKRLNVVAPAAGIVKGLKYHSVGSVVPAGDVVAEIVPISGVLVAQVRISPRDIGHVKIGSKVLLKFDTYNFSHYGSISGRLDQVSASSFIDKRGNTYFKGMIILPRDYVGTDPKSNRVTVGMTVVADIQTGEKTLMQYLVRPINNALDSSFRER